MTECGFASAETRMLTVPTHVDPLLDCVQSLALIRLQVKIMQHRMNGAIMVGMGAGIEILLLGVRI